MSYALRRYESFPANTHFVTHFWIIFVQKYFTIFINNNSLAGWTLDYELRWPIIFSKNRPTPYWRDYRNKQSSNASPISRSANYYFPRLDQNENSLSTFNTRNVVENGL